jgi:hypothetical protein
MTQGAQKYTTYQQLYVHGIEIFKYSLLLFQNGQQLPSL